jgi:hypothetical protein
VFGLVVLLGGVELFFGFFDFRPVGVVVSFCDSGVVVVGDVGSVGFAGGVEGAGAAGSGVGLGIDGSGDVGTGVVGVGVVGFGVPGCEGRLGVVC